MTNTKKSTKHRKSSMKRRKTVYNTEEKAIFEKNLAPWHLFNH